MDTKTVHLVVEGTIHEGSFEALETLAKQMVAGSEKEPGTLGYEWYLSAEHRSFRLLETYVDGAAVTTHFKGPVVQLLVPKMMELIKLDSFELYGEPGTEARAMLAGFGVRIFDAWRGLSR